MQLNFTQTRFYFILFSDTVTTTDSQTDTVTSDNVSTETPNTETTTTQTQIMETSTSGMETAHIFGPTFLCHALHILKAFLAHRLSSV